MKTRLCASLLLLPGALSAAYQYYYSDNLTSINGANWQQNGSLTATSSGLTATGTGGSLISKIAVPDGTSEYEVKATLNLASSGGYYYLLLRASNDAFPAWPGTGSIGTYYEIAMLNPTFSDTGCTSWLSVAKRSGGVVTILSFNAVMPCFHTTTIRAVMSPGSGIGLYINGIHYGWLADSSIVAGRAGIAASQMPASNSISNVSLGVLDRTLPETPNPQSIATSAYPNEIDLQWQGALDDANGVGVAYYTVLRNGIYFQWTQTGELVDATVEPASTYTYIIFAADYHGNYSVPAYVSVATPPATGTNPRRVGVRSTGTYWGAEGEQVDMWSGNLNFTVPLIHPKSRSGAGMTFGLTYNSQLWRQDPAATWKLGRDVGYGFGWKLLAGSITPYWSDPYTIHHYLFTDATGAEYRLNLNNGGVWTSQEGTYVSYDSNTQRLYFPDGTFWLMGCTSGGAEQDAGTAYPTIMQDTNGNQITIQYYAGIGLSSINTSARIQNILDIRAMRLGSGPYTYTFTYNGDAIPHLASIFTGIYTTESYTFAYQANQGLNSPFSPPVGFGTTTLLQAVNMDRIGTSYQFQYDSNGSGELNQVTFPYRGHLRWAYTSWPYTGNQWLREVQYRYLSMSSGAAEFTYPIGRPGGDWGANVHSGATVADPSGVGEKAWSFVTTPGAWNIGFLSSLQERSAAGVTSPVPRQQDYTWTQDAVGNPYVASVVTTLDGGSPDARQSKAAQTLDLHGNLTQVQQFDYGNLTTPARIYNSTYLTDPNYTSRYIHNRLVSTTVSLGDGSGVVSLVSNKYDGQNDGTCSSVGLVEAKDLAPPPFSQHDASYNAYFIYRGNVKQSKQFGLPWICQYYDVTGMVVSASDRVRSITITPAANNAVPGIITPGSNSNLATTAGYDIALHLTSLLVPNGAQGTSEYASSGLLSKTKSYHGAETNYRYTFNPNTVTATTNTRWTRKTLDGFGREIQTEAGYLNGSAEVTTSIQTTTYGPCACSPLGKPASVSQPYAPGATNIYYTVTHYDALGRTTSTVSPDGASTTTYSYAGNATTVTDPAGHWKMFTRDAMGNLTVVTEPNPAGGANWTTSYTYDAPNRLTLVSMPRGSSTQTRTFTYEDTRIRTATNPESGTVTYTYNSDTTLATKVDANGNHLHYWYDTMGRLSKITVGDSQAAEYAFSYDSPSQNAYGRLAAVSFGGYSWIYSYTPGGLVSSKSLRLTRGNSSATLATGYIYDNEGKVLMMISPTTYPPNPSGGGHMEKPGQTYTYSYDLMGRPAGLVQSGDPATPWVSNVQYGPANELLQIQILPYEGSQDYHFFTEKRTYNSRLQLTSIQLTEIAGQFPGMNLQYSYSPNQNNGQITQFRDTVSGEQVSYAYDSLNRLISATAANGTWGQGYTYDGYGNLLAKTVTQGSGPQLSVAVAPATNRVIGVTYDANGNVIQEMNGTRLVYDAFNRVRKVTFLAECTYGYGPDNEQMETNCTDTGGPYTVLYGADGRRMGGYSSAVDRTGRLYFSGGVHTVYFAGRPIDVSGRMFLALDRLGSVRPPKTAQTRTGYYPYGEEQQASTTEWWNFATYYRHPGTELDYAVNRYYSPRLGRFISPDPYYSSAALTDPRQWNRYSYVGNDPVNFNDPSGDRMNWFDDGGNGGWGGPYSVPVWGPEGYEGSFFVFPDTTRNVSFAPSGGGGGAGTASRPTDAVTDATARKLLGDRLNGFGQSNCDKVFDAVIEGYTTKSLTASVRKTEFYNVNTSGISGLKQNQVSGNGNNTLLAARG